MKRQPKLIEVSRARRPRRVLMRLVDAGSGYLNWHCDKCGHDLEVFSDAELPMSYSEPCSKCGPVWGMRR